MLTKYSYVKSSARKDCNPIPFIPFPLARGRGRNRKRGEAPLRRPRFGGEAASWIAIITCIL
jgi:hypothetical protein